MGCTGYYGTFGDCGVCVIVSSLLIFISSLSYCLVIWLPIGIYRGFLAKVGFVLNSLGIQKARRTFKFSGLEIVLFCGRARLKHLRDLKIITSSSSLYPQRSKDSDFGLIPFKDLDS